METQSIKINLIVEDPVTDVRVGPKLSGESKLIKELADDIGEVGLTNPITLRGPNEKGQYRLIAGRRRTEAFKLLDLKEIPAIVNDEDTSDEQAFRIAFSENHKRKNFTALQLALLMAKLRKDNDWKDVEGTKLVASSLGVSEATVREHEKLLEQPKDIQNAVHTGAMSFAAAQSLWADTVEEKKETVAKRAAEIAKSEDSEKAKSYRKTVKVEKSGKQVKAPVQVQKKHVQKAAKELDAEKTVKPRGRNDLLEPFEMILEAADGYSSEVTAFCKYFVKTYATGGGSSNGVIAKIGVIDEIVDAKKARAAKREAA